ncbi:LD-carboxypeptidase [Umezawaea tangerina]|uniref:Muramoyltetrapeptide carboxypeptidase n=1 Tax=Umezawaea tangerina TaxID=84725 RepID=A0A2T0SVR4_9PSEU|nr:LD-carboxypeptidase [Umezawaea tangerina]PRY37517.1 muramoyltetrapeptide carboxypeptidase [Umezawaea tangerina]
MDVTARPRRDVVTPPRLRTGDEVALLSLSGPLAARCPRRLARAERELGRRGLIPRTDPTALLDTGSTAGPAEVRAAHLTAAILDPAVRAVVSTVGGVGTRDLLPHLDPAALAGSPTSVVGYSDTTSLLLWLYHRLGWTTYYGPAVLPQFGEHGGTADFTWRSFWEQLSGPGGGGVLPSTDDIVVETLFWDTQDDRPRAVGKAIRAVWSPGLATGPLVAANIATLADDLRAGLHAGIGWDGHVVCLEESDSASETDLRDAVEVLADSGLLDGAAALLVGRFAQDHRHEWPPGLGRRLLEPLARRVSGPVVADCEFGHTDPVLTLPIGAVAEVSAPVPGRGRPEFSLVSSRSRRSG